MEILLHIVFGVIVALAAAAFLLIDMAGRVDYLKQKAPWLERILEKRSALAGLLLVEVFLLIGDGYELYNKQMPPIPSAPEFKSNTPPPPIQLPPQIARGDRPSQIPSSKLEGATLLSEVSDSNLKAKAERIGQELESNWKHFEISDEKMQALQKSGTPESERIAKVERNKRWIALADQNKKSLSDARTVRDLLLERFGDKDESYNKLKDIIAKFADVAYPVVRP